MIPATRKILSLPLFVSFLLLAGCASCEEDEAVVVARDMGVADMAMADAAGGLDLGPPRKIGEPCAMSAGCEEGAVCVGAGRPGELDRCYYSCTTQGRLCPQNGALCVSSQFPEPVCYTGGTAPLGGGCIDSTSCASGLTCVRGREEAQDECRRACHKDDPVCVAPERCTIAADDGRGYCAAP